MYEGHIYEYYVAAFGIKNSGAASIRCFVLPLRGLSDFILNFVDDLLIVSENLDTHLEHLEVLFMQLLSYNITLKFSKCYFVTPKAGFSGFVLTPRGICLQENKLKQILL